MSEISVIIPVYNMEKYLADCVKSVLNQSFDDISVILVDDGSTDSSADICNQAAAKDARITVVHKQNGGVSSARNKGLEYVSSKYVTFLDSDDCFEKDWLLRLYENAEKHNADIVIGNLAFVTEDTETILDATQHETGVYTPGDYQAKNDYIIKKILASKHGWEVCSRLFRTDLILQNGIRFCETCHNFAEDMAFTLECTLFAGTIVSLPDCGYLYRQHGSSMMASSTSAVKLDSMNEVSHHFAEVFTRVYPEDRKYLPYIHYLIMFDQYKKLVLSADYCRIGEYNKMITDQAYRRKMGRALHRSRSVMMEYNSEFKTKQMMLFNHYCLHGNWKRFRIESALFYKLIKNRD